MSCLLVGIRKSLRTSGHAQESSATGSDEGQPLTQSRAVVLKVLEDFERTYEVELAAAYPLQPAVHEPHGVESARFEASARCRYGCLVEVDPEVIESIGEENG